MFSSGTFAAIALAAILLAGHEVDWIYRREKGRYRVLRGQRKAKKQE